MECGSRVECIRVTDPEDESVSEISGSVAYGSVSVRFEPQGSRWWTTVGGAVLGGKLVWSVALLLASCLVSKGMGVDGARDSLTVRVQSFKCRRFVDSSKGSVSGVGVKKKVEGLRVTLASLTETTDRTTVSLLHRVELELQEVE